MPLNTEQAMNTSQNRRLKTPSGRSAASIPAFLIASVCLCSAPGAAFGQMRGAPQTGGAPGRALLRVPFRAATPQELKFAGFLVQSRQIARNADLSPHRAHLMALERFSPRSEAQLRALGAMANHLRPNFYDRLHAAQSSPERWDAEGSKLVGEFAGAYAATVDDARNAVRSMASELAVMAARGEAGLDALSRAAEEIAPLSMYGPAVEMEIGRAQAGLAAARSGIAGAEMRRAHERARSVISEAEQARIQEEVRSARIRPGEAVVLPGGNFMITKAREPEPLHGQRSLFRLHKWEPRPAPDANFTRPPQGYRPVNEISAPAGFQIRSADYSKDGGSILLVAGHPHAAEPAVLTRLDSKTGQRLAIPGSSDPRNGRFATSGDNGTVHIWDAGTGERLAILKGHSGEVAAADFSRDGNRIVTAGKDGGVLVWDVKTGKKQWAVKPGWVLSAKFSPDGERLLVTRYFGARMVLDAGTGRPIAGIRSRAKPRGLLAAAVYTGTGLLAVASSLLALALLAGHAAYHGLTRAGNRKR